MKTTIRKKMLAIITAFMFVGMMGLSVTTSLNGPIYSLIGLEVLAGQIGSASASATCASPCSYTSCSMSGYYQVGCMATQCQTCTCEGYDEFGFLQERTIKDCPVV